MLPKKLLLLSFSIINCFAIDMSLIVSVLSLCMYKSMVWLRRGWDIVDRRKVLRRLRAENVLSAVAVVTGSVKNICSSLKTSDNISFPIPTSFMISQIVRTFVTFFTGTVFGFLVFLVRIRSGSINNCSFSFARSMSFLYSCNSSTLQAVLHFQW